MEGGRLCPMRSSEAEGAEFPEVIRREAFLELRVEVARFAKRPEDRFDRELAGEFYRLLPTLALASYDLDRINQFAPVLAVFRWAKARGRSN